MLFTLQRLVVKLMTQLQQLAANDLTAALADLYTLEHARSGRPVCVIWELQHTCV